MFKPQKGKSFDKLPSKTLESFGYTKYLVSIKYDGNQIFICKQGTEVRFFTSNWKEFVLPRIKHKISLLPGDFTLVCEMNYDSLGKLGDRTLVQGKLTTERFNFAKGLGCSLDESLVKIKIFDYLDMSISRGYRDRLAEIEEISYLLPAQLQIVQTQLMTGNQARSNLPRLISEGWEGYMLAEPNESYRYGKRVNHCIKLKECLTADLKCIDTEPGEGKYVGMIGSLVLEDSLGRVVRVGSGLSDIDRGYPEDYFIGKVIEIKYEQIMDTYQHPTFVVVRDKKEID